MKITYNRKNFYCNDDEFTSYTYLDYSQLKLVKSLGALERLTGLLNDLSTDIFSNNIDLVTIGITHGGFIPVHCSDYFKNVFINNFDKVHLENINKNLLNIKNVKYDSKSDSDSIIFINENTVLGNKDIYQESNNFILTEYTLNYKYKFQLSNTPYFLYVPQKYYPAFLKNFSYFLVNDILNYDNLVHFTMIIKNGGDSLEEMLTRNLSYIDRWTILDTGSTDGTQDVIRRVLAGKKGKLYEEPFVDFKVSRNRCIDLAGKDCKFLIMLDDTYIVNKDLRAFLNSVRDDTFADSFSLIVKSNDVEYSSNRIVKSALNLRYIYKIHEVFEENTSVLIPYEAANIHDLETPYMKNRSIERKNMDLKMLFEEYEEDPLNPRHLYYIAQTYSIMGDYEKAAEFFLKRVEHQKQGFHQEKLDAYLELARIYNFRLNKPWELCEKYYHKCYEMDENRPDVPYFIGAHFYMKNERKKAFENFKKAFEIGYSVIHQHSLKPTIYFYFAPKFLAELCYEEGEYELGEKACQVFLNNNPPTDESFKFMLDWYKIYQLLSRKLTNNYKVPEKKLLVFLADGGFNTWTGKDILTKGVGGSETHTIEMARYLKKHSDFEVIVFCNCEEDDEFEGVKYMHLTKIFKFFSENFIDTVFISRYSEYIPFAIQSGTDNIYVVLHDLGPTGSIIPVHPKLKKIFCLSEWHVSLVKKNFSALEDRIEHFYYGIDPVKWGGKIEKVANRFIYSSFPNRGLLPLLQMWPKICSKIKDAELHIYCDVNGKWVNDNFPDEMNLIRQMLAEAKQVVYHGWVNKEELAKGWLSADVWFYPCKFMETFCLTALEAAYTRTLAITNGLAALENTVGERGVTIEGDVMTEDWQDRALGAIVWALGNKKYKDKLLDTNYNWASEMTWEQRAKEMLHIYLNQNIYENKDVFNWTHNFPINMDSRGTFERILNRLSLKNINDLRVLEVGTHTGVSLIEIIKSVPNSIGYGVDKWDDKIGVEDSFYSNIRRAELKERIFGVKGETTNVLTVMTKSTQRFGLINVDGYENNLDIYGDLLFYWELLIRGGILSIDYTLKEGIKRFFEKYRGEYRILVISNRVFLEKL